MSPMVGPFGATVSGADLSLPLDEATSRELIDALFEHRILLVPDQRLSEREYLRFGRLWGPPLLFFRPEGRHGDLPELIKIRNSPATPPQQRDGAMHWHSDSSYEAEPASVTMLYALESPSSGNETLFADMVAAYEALPEETRAQIDSLEVIHDPRGGRVSLSGEKRGKASDDGGLPVVRHPLVSRHPVVGRKALFGISGTACGIVGWDEQSGIDLLIELKKHALQPQFRQGARAAAGSVLIWDNYSVMHSATPTEYSNEEGKRRLLYRISTRGLPPLYGRAANES
jgi:taurine dioxygenase